MDAADEPGVTEVVVMKSAQVGWTECINNSIGRQIHRSPGPMMLMQPTLEMGEAWSKDRFAPMVRDTPCLFERIADPKSRDSGNTLLHKKFAGGHLTIVGANSPSSLASRPIRFLYCDEVDRYPESAGAEGDPIDLARRRTLTFRNRKVLIGSTPTVKGSSRIEAAFDQSDQRYYFVPCPHCEEFQRLVWSQVRWQEGSPETAGYVCQHCGNILTDIDKPEMLRRGEWRGTKPFNGIAGFHISELYSPWTSWPEMVAAFLRAKKLPETLQTWINTALGETWEERAAVEASGLMARVESYNATSLPPGVLFITAGTDVQDDRLETSIYGWGVDEEAWRIEHVVLRGDPGSSALWEEHDEILRRRFTTDDGRELVIEACAVDSGGHFTQQVYAYCARRKRFRIWAIKGVAGVGRLVWPKKASRGGKLRVDLWLIGVDTAKDVIFGRLKAVSQPGPGYIHFDANTSKEWFDQLTSEVVGHRVVLGRRIRHYKPKSTDARQEALDCTIYAYAAMIGRGGSSRLTARAKAIDRAKAGDDAPPKNFDQEPAPPAAEERANAPSQEGASSAAAAPLLKRKIPRVRSNFINRWRR